MHTNWVAPGKGDTLAKLLLEGNAAFPHLCGLPGIGDESRITNLVITSRGWWEEYDIERIRNVSWFVTGGGKH